MIARNCSQADLEKALAIVNERYGGNIVFKTLEPDPKCKTGLRFTLTVKSARAVKGIHPPGVRRGFNHPWENHKPRAIAAACWHVHGHFFEALFSINPDARVKSGSMHHGELDGWITKEDGNWKDTNVGSVYHPVMYSEACFCDE